MSTTDMTVDEALRLLRAVVDAKGTDYIDTDVILNGCVYTDPAGSPSCIIGHWMDRAGLDRPMHGSEGNDDTVEALAHMGKLLLPPDVMDLLRAAQMAQDAGRSWRVALRAAAIVAARSSAS